MSARIIRALAAASSREQANALAGALEADGDITVVGRPASPGAVVALVASARPDIVVLDIRMAGDSVGGGAAIAQIMDRTPTPILVLSPGGVDRDSPPVVDALVAGALDALPAPARWTPERGDELRRRARQLSNVQVIRHMRGRRRSGEVAHGNLPPVVAVAASTGGPSAIATLLAGFGELAVPVLVVQHLHPQFTSGLLGWMARSSALPVEMASPGQFARPGKVYLAPTGMHLRLGPGQRLELGTEPVITHRPSADVLFASVAEHAGAAGVGVLLTGMGDDGARGLLEIREAGGQTFAQDEQSCAVFGMPRAAWQLGAVRDLHPLDKLAAVVSEAVASIGGRR